MTATTDRSGPKVHLVDRPLLTPLTVSHTQVRAVQLLEVRVQVAGARGTGEVSVGPWAPQSGQEVTASAERVLAVVQDAAPQDAAALGAALGAAYDEELPVATLAVEMAWLDALSLAAGQPLHRYLGLPAPPVMPLFSTVDIEAVRDAPWEHRPGRYKVKLGGPSDERVLASCASAVGSQFLFDVNSGWDQRTYRRLRPALVAAHALAVEDPLREPADLAALRPYWRAHGVVLDESVRSESDVAAVADAAAGVNLKLLKLGGLLPAVRAARRARKGGAQVLLGCFTEPPRAIAYAAHLLGLVDLADLDGEYWLTGLLRSEVRLAPGPGIGGLLP